jgi:hypothetical protein
MSSTDKKGRLISIFTRGRPKSRRQFLTSIGAWSGVALLSACTAPQLVVQPETTAQKGQGETTLNAQTSKTYELDGSLLEACSCGGPCPCWVGDDPDGGTCDAFNAYHIDRGQINGVNVSGLTFVRIAQIPGNVLAGNWREILYVDDRATPPQRQAIVDAFTGNLGGPLADLASLVGERVAVYSAAIDHRVEGGKGTLSMGDLLYSEMAPYTDAAGRPTKLVDTMFTTIPGSAAIAAKASIHRVQVPEHGMVWEFTGRNAIQGDFHFEA